MAKKEDTPIRRARRNYEARNKEEREQATKQYNTRLPRELHNEICAFLKKNRITKVELIVAGYQALLDHYDLPLIEKVTVYMGNRELTKEDMQKYVCVSTAVNDIVINVYNRHQKQKYLPSIEAS